MNSKRKGKDGELELVEKLRYAGYAHARRSAQYCGNTGDAPDIVGIDDLHIECKRVEAFRDEVALQQAENDAKKNEIPVVMYRRNKEKWKVCMRLDLFMLIWRELSDLQRHNILEKKKFMRQKGQNQKNSTVK